MTKQDVLNIFEKVKDRYKKEIYSKLPKIRLNFVEHDTFLDLFENSMMFKETNLFIKADTKDFPVFAYVNPFENSLSYLATKEVLINFSLDQLKLFENEVTREEMEVYLTQVFAHEITHIINDKLRILMRNEWKTAIEESSGLTSFANDIFANIIANKLVDTKKYAEVEDKLWGKLYSRLKEVTI